MYKPFFGLHRNPFMMTSDPAFLYPTAQHCEALAGLLYAVMNEKGFVALTGEAGTGKTTLVTRFLQQIPAGRIRCSLISFPTLTPDEFLEMTLLNFGLTAIPASKAQRLEMLRTFLLEGSREGRITALIVDEAHKLSPELLEEIRLLSNFDNCDGKLLQIVLAGQGELNAVLSREDLRQLKQRIAVRLTLQPLTAGELEQYVGFRWEKAGAEFPHPFAGEAIHEVARLSRGIPRLINSLCDNALMVAFAERSSVVTAKHILEAAADLDLNSTQPVPATAAPPSAPAVASVPFELVRAAGPIAPIRRSFSVLNLDGDIDGNGTDNRKPSFWMRWFGKPASAN